MKKNNNTFLLNGCLKVIYFRDYEEKQYSMIIGHKVGEAERIQLYLYKKSYFFMGSKCINRISEKKIESRFLNNFFLYCNLYQPVKPIILSLQMSLGFTLLYS